MKLLKAERQDKILDILSMEKKIIASEMSVRLGVSEDTIRRDIKELDQKGLLKKVHSGAVKSGPAKTKFYQRLELDLDEKIRLAKKGAALIEQGSVVLIDDGTTNYQLVNQLDQRISCTIITNSIPIINLLENYPNVQVITLGGNLFKASMANLGYETMKQLDTLHPDLYFMGIYSISDEVGVTHSALDECQLKQKMLSVSSQTAALVTKEKIGSVSNYVVCNTGDLTYVITDSEDSDRLGRS
ncbi:MAG: DeoR/GlpR family DNA-binding transcription regulator [Anaerostipes sp.]|uniref:DeoR/GlpR family DNA-binding transcription regulator n=1 Tax=Anaerostipes sp. TaxID=1872530 RepID=UPI00399381AD